MGVWIHSFISLMNPLTLLWLIIGSIVGLIFGALPGIGPSLAMAIVIPFSFYMDAHIGLPLLTAVWGSAIVGGSITAILINTPGTGGNVATCFDGFPLAQQGKAKIALGISTSSSAIGGIVGSIVLYIGIIAFSKILVLFGPAELFLLGIVAILVLAVIFEESPLKTLIAGFSGLLISFIGYDIITGYVRFDLGTRYLYDGIEFLTMVIGLFAIARMMELVTHTEIISETNKLLGSMLEGLLIPFKYIKTVLRSILIGIFIGFLPGLGISSAALLAYGAAKKSSSKPETFGKGNYEGVVAPETANNAVIGGAMIPGLALGIPGNSDTAVFLAALMMYGISPGQSLLVRNSDLVILIVASLIFINLIFTLNMIVFHGILARLTTLPLSYLVPPVVVLALTGAFAISSNIWDVTTAIIFGFIGYGMIKLKYPVVAFLMGRILGPVIESNFGRALIISGGSYSIFFKSIISKILVISIIVFIVLTLFRLRSTRFIKKKAIEK